MSPKMFFPLLTLSGHKSPSACKKGGKRKTKSEKRLSGWKQRGASDPLSSFHFHQKGRKWGRRKWGDLRAVVLWRVQQQRRARLVFFQQLRDLLIVWVGVQGLVVVVVFLFIFRAPLQSLRLWILLLLGRGHLCCVLFPPFSPSVLKPHLRNTHGPPVTFFTFIYLFRFYTSLGQIFGNWFLY